MSSYDQTVRVKARYYAAGKNFFSFLNAIGRKFSRQVKINYRYLGRGRFYIMVDGGPGGIEALFQELLLNRGLYYYGCTLRGKHKKDIITHVVVPLFQQLLEERFPYSHARFLRRHIYGKISQDKHIPGEFANQFSHEYEVLYRKWDLGSLDDRNFIKDLDELLTRFMLTMIGHRPGDRSPAFHVLVDRAYRTGLGMDEEHKGVFNKVHAERTNELHRLSGRLTKEQINAIATEIYIYFSYFDEFQGSQRVKMEKLHGRRYRRIRYGYEMWLDGKGQPYKDDSGHPIDAFEEARTPCYDCGAIRGQYHCEGCDIEQCARCGGQRLGCPCKLQKDVK